MSSTDLAPGGDASGEPSVSARADGPASPAWRDAVLERVTRRLVPFLCVIYFSSFLDRVNVGFAALTMNPRLGLSATAFGFGTGVFFFGYVLFEIPSNLALRRFGARRWLARIMVAWGLCSTATAFAWNDTSFYVVRFLLGATEAGLLPGVLLYLTCWIPGQHRARIFGLFMVAIALSGLVGAPLSSLLFGLDGVAGLAGWQWMFLVEGLPAVLLGFAALAYLTDDPSRAAWLDGDQREWLQSTIDQEEASRASLQAWSFGRTLASPRVWGLGLVNFSLLVGLYSVSFWMPLMIREAGVRHPLSIGLIAAAPALVGAVSMIAWSRRSGRRGEPTRHLAGAIMLGSAGFAAAALSSSPIGVIICLVAASAGVYAALPLFWTLPTSFLSGAGMATGLALINSISNVGGYVGPQLMGYVKDRTASYGLAFAVIAAILTGAVLILLGVGSAVNRRRNADGWQVATNRRR